MTYEYAPRGDSQWMSILAGQCVILIRDRADLSVPLWDALHSQTPIESALQVLVGQGLTDMPTFAIASWSRAPGSNAVAFVRGDVSVVAQTSAGVERTSPTQVSTWSELSFNGVLSLVISAPGASTDYLPISEGVVWADAVSLGVFDEALPPTADHVVPERSGRKKSRTAASGASRPASAQESTIGELPELPELPELAEVAEGSMGYGHLFEATVLRSIEDAAIRPREDEPEEAEMIDDEDGDHDGMTVFSTSLPHRSVTLPLPNAVVTPEPTLPFLEFPNGDRESLHQPIVVGRSPSIANVPSGQVPRLVTISGENDISRNHASFALEGDTVVVTDLHSRNGTSVTFPGRAPQALRPGEPTPVILATVVDLGGALTVTVRAPE